MKDEEASFVKAHAITVAEVHGRESNEAQIEWRNAESTSE